jgi:thiosulfate/3-mercaptopyruvate sulfurtransferase
MTALLLCLTMLGANEYARPDLLIEAADLAKKTDKYIVLDVRNQEAYDQGHVPEARRVDPSTWSKSFDSQDADGWSKRIGDLGISADAKVVAYDDGTSKDAARIWWILRYWGVQNVRLLNGGWTAWKESKSPVQASSPSPASAVSFEAKPIAARFADKNLLLGSLTEKSLQIVDARSAGEFCGDEKLTNKKAGAIPGAKHLEWSDLIDGETKRFKPADQIQVLFEKAGIDVTKPTATHCQGGGRSSVMAFGLELMGADEVHNYYNGWSEWGNADDTPVVVPK